MKQSSKKRLLPEACHSRVIPPPHYIKSLTVVSMVYRLLHWLWNTNYHIEATQPLLQTHTHSVQSSSHDAAYLCMILLSFSRCASVPWQQQNWCSQSIFWYINHFLLGLEIWWVMHLWSSYLRSSLFPWHLKHVSHILKILSDKVYSVEMRRLFPDWQLFFQPKISQLPQIVKLALYVFSLYWKAPSTVCFCGIV